MLLTAAIVEVNDARRPLVYFLTGNGEHQLSDFREFQGLSSLARALHRDNFVTSELVSGDNVSVPQDCDALVIAGSQKRLSRGMLGAIADYLSHNGRLLLLQGAGPGTGLESMFEDYGVLLDTARIVSPPALPAGLDRALAMPGGETRRIIELTAYADHPVTRRMQGIVSNFYKPRPLRSCRLGAPM